ncbi:hypothetical protein B0H13DRAFT_2007081 [Mycena leptocephala]|nr:hypothetical protein B0H13DRAFT_2007081 [Mycena leptocephala]
MANGFPWGVFSANTLRPMMSDILRSDGHTAGPHLNKETSITLLQNIEKHGLDAALKDLRAEKILDAPPSAKRKHRDAQSVSAPAAPRTRARNPDAKEGLLTRRQAAQSRGDNISPTRSWKPAARKLKNDDVKPKSTGQVFDGVEIERETEEPESDEVEAGSDVDAEGEVVDDAIELETGTSSLENSNKENDVTLTELANADTDNDADGEDVPHPEDIGSPTPEITVEHTEPPQFAVEPSDIEEARLNPDVPEIGSPAPQITVEPTDDQIEEARLNHDASLDIGSPAPEITIEPLADDGDDEQIQFEFEAENGYSEERAGTPLNPEYSIEVFSPTSVQHDSDDEMWVIKGINGNSKACKRQAGDSGPLIELLPKICDGYTCTFPSVLLYP